MTPEKQRELVRRLRSYARTSTLLTIAKDLNDAATLLAALIKRGESQRRFLGYRLKLVLEGVTHYVVDDSVAGWIFTSDFNPKPVPRSEIYRLKAMVGRFCREDRVMRVWEAKDLKTIRVYRKAKETAPITLEP